MGVQVGRNDYSSQRGGEKGDEGGKPPPEPRAGDAGSRPRWGEGWGRFNPESLSREVIHGQLRHPGWAVCPLLGRGVRPSYGGVQYPDSRPAHGGNGDGGAPLRQGSPKKVRQEPNRKFISEWKLPQLKLLKLLQHPRGRLYLQKSRRGVFEGDESTGGWPGGNSVAPGGVFGNRSDPPARARPVHTPTPTTAIRAAWAQKLRGMVLSARFLQAPDSTVCCPSVMLASRAPPQLLSSGPNRLETQKDRHRLASRRRRSGYSSFADYPANQATATPRDRLGWVSRHHSRHRRSPVGTSVVGR